MTIALIVAAFIGGMITVWWLKRNDTLDKLSRDRAYWRKSYEDLVLQTGRDLNDGLGPDPRKTWAVERWHGPAAGRDDIVEAALEAFFPDRGDGHLAWTGNAGSLGLTTYRSEWESRMRRAIGAAVKLLTADPAAKTEEADEVR